MKKRTSYNLTQLRGAWGAGKAGSSKRDPLIGMFFHIINKEGEVQYQGTIVKKHKEDEYFVCYFDFIFGNASTEREIVNFKDKTKFAFYDSDYAMRMGYNRRMKISKDEANFSEEYAKLKQKIFDGEIP